MKTKIVKSEDLSGTLLARHYVGVNLGNVKKFIDCFQKNLTEAYDKNPMNYTYPRTGIPVVVEKYREMLLTTKGKGMLKTVTVEKTMKELGIKSMKALAEWISSPE